MQRKKKNASNFSKEDEEGEKRQRLEDEEGGFRAVASVENIPNSGAFSGAHNMQAWTILVLYPCECCDSGAGWGHWKNTWRGMVSTVMPKHKSCICMYVLWCCLQHHHITQVFCAWSGSCEPPCFFFSLLSQLCHSWINTSTCWFLNFR